MVYDEGLAQRIIEALEDKPGLEEKKMFGGVGYLLDGNMACGINNEDLIVRVGPQFYETALAQPYVKVFDTTGRPMKGWVLIEPAGYESDDDLKYWLQKGIDYSMSLPPK